MAWVNSTDGIDRTLVNARVVITDQCSEVSTNEIARSNNSKLAASSLPSHLINALNQLWVENLHATHATIMMSASHNDASASGVSLNFCFGE